MNFKILIVLIMYYSFLSVMFLGISPLNNPESVGTTTTNLTLISQGQPEPENASFWSVFGSVFNNIIKFFAFIGFGVYLSGAAPSWFGLGFAIWQTIVTIFSVAFFIDAIWGG